MQTGIEALNQVHHDLGEPESIPTEQMKLSNWVAKCKTQSTFTDGTAIQWNILLTHHRMDIDKPPEEIARGFKILCWIPFKFDQPEQISSVDLSINKFHWNYAPCISGRQGNLFNKIIYVEMTVLLGECTFSCRVSSQGSLSKASRLLIHTQRWLFVWRRSDEALEIRQGSSNGCYCVTLLRWSSWNQTGIE